MKNHLQNRLMILSLFNHAVLKSRFRNSHKTVLKIMMGRRTSFARNNRI